MEINFKMYVDNLNRLLEEKPEIANFIVLTSKDDEGNGFNIVNYSPQLVVYSGYDEVSFLSGGEVNVSDLNAVLVN